jgi:8-oxo-dGTP diphosphatase
MNHLPPHIRVVAAAIERQGRYLITRRSSTAVLAGLWEFPSCKVGANETDEAALRRELWERLGVDVDADVVAGSRTHSYDGYVVDLVLHRVGIPSGQAPHPLRVAELRWVEPRELEDYSFPSADQGTTDLLLGIVPDPRCTPGHSPFPPVPEIITSTTPSGSGQGDPTFTDLKSPIRRRQ